MSSKAAKKSSSSSTVSATASSSSQSHHVTTSSSTASTSAASTPGIAPGRPSSPLSPTRLSRIQEKHELQNLNDRLAVYIDRVRHLEQENTKLTRQIHTSQETKQKEVITLKSMYDKEVSDARKALDDVSKDRARLQIECNKLRAENEDLKGRLDKKSRDVIQKDKTITILENQVADLTGKYNQAANDRAKLDAEKRELVSELDKVRKTLDSVRKELETETMIRVDLENKNQSLREEMSFKDQVHQQQIQETRTRKQIEITELDGRLQEEYEAKMQKSLQELRDQYEAQLQANKGEVERMFEGKLNDLKSQVQRYSNVATTGAEDLRQSRSRVEALVSRVSELESAQAGYLARIRDLEKMVDNDRMRFSDILADREAEIQRLREEMASHMQEYQDLMDVKVALDMEIAAYRKLLEGEEARLNITPTKAANQQKGTTPARRTPMRGTKRKRTIIEESEELSHSDFTTSSSSLGEIEVSEVCPEGKFVKLHNKGDKEISLGGWQVIRRVGDEETAYKFHRTVKIEAKGHVAIWSADSGIQHDPPTNLLMKGQRWFVGDNMTTTLFNSNGDEVAVQECRRKQLSSSSLHHRDLGGFGASYPVVEVGNEDMFHQQGDPRGRENCSIM